MTCLNTLQKLVLSLLFIRSVDAIALLDAFLITWIISSRLSSPTIIPLAQKHKKKSHKNEYQETTWETSHDFTFQKYLHNMTSSLCLWKLETSTPFNYWAPKVEESLQVQNLNRSEKSSKPENAQFNRVASHRHCLLCIKRKRNLTNSTKNYSPPTSKPH